MIIFIMSRNVSFIILAVQKKIGIIGFFIFHRAIHLAKLIQKNLKMCFENVMYTDIYIETFSELYKCFSAHSIEWDNFEHKIK